MDTRQWLLNCPNGTVDLCTGDLQEHRREDHITKLCPTEYHREATAPTWEKFLLDVFQENKGLVKWLQKLLGYCITGDVSEQIMPIFWGEGSNGKSTLLTVLYTVLGSDYTGKAPQELLLSTKYQSHPTDKTTLFGKRLVSAVESGETSKLNETVIKELTGG